LEHALQVLKPYLDHYGYLAVLGAIFLEDFGVPMPGETLLIAGALLATQGHFNIYLLVAVAWVGAVMGDNLGYLIGSLGGRRLVLRFGRYLFITPKRLQYAESFFQRRGPIIVVIARFIEILRQLNGIIAGTTKMAWWRFFLYNSLGAALWVGLWSTLFYQLGKEGERIGFLFKRYEPLALAAFALVAAAALVVHLVRRRRTAASEGGGTGRGAPDRGGE